MQTDVALAQAQTLRQWADDWMRQAEVGRGDNEVSMLLHRAARAMERTAQPEADAGAVEPAPLPPPTEVVQLRDG